MIHKKEIAVMDALNALSIPFERFEHDAADTMADCEVFDANKQAAHCKNLFLCNRQGTQFYLLLLAGEKPFKTKDLSKQLGISRLSFGTPAQLAQMLGLTPGAVSPMGLLNDPEKKVHVLVDRDLTVWENIIVHPNVNTASIIMKTADLVKFLQSMGHRLTDVEIFPGEEQESEPSA